MTDQDTSPEAVGRMAARLCTSQQPSIGQRRSIAATLCALSAERDEMTRRRDYWKALAEGQDFTRVYLETCAERDALKAELAEAVEVMRRYEEELRLIRMKDTGAVYDVLLRTDARTFFARHQKEAGV